MPDSQKDDFSPKPLSSLRFHNPVCLAVWLGCIALVSWVFRSGALAAWDRHVNLGPNPGGFGWLASLSWGFLIGTLLFGLLYVQAMSFYGQRQYKRHVNKQDPGDP